MVSSEAVISGFLLHISQIVLRHRLAAILLNNQNNAIMKKYVLVILAVAMATLVGCDKRDMQTPEPQQSGWEANELQGRVKRVVETDCTITTPELFGYCRDGFRNEDLIDYKYQLIASRLRYGYAPDSEEIPEDFYHESSWSRYYDVSYQAENLPFTVMCFNENGDMTHIIKYREDSYYDRQTVCEFDDRHHAISERSYSGELLESEYEYEYNADGFSVGWKYSTADGEEASYVTHYDKKNYPTYGENYRGDTLDYRMTYSYDRYGNVVRETAEGSWEGVWEYDYLYGKGDKRDLVTRQAYYSPKDNLVSVNITEYNDDLTEKYCWGLNHDGDTTEFSRYRIDSKMRDTYIACSRFDEDGNEIGGYVATTEYDERDNMIFYEYTGSVLWDYYLCINTFDEKNRLAEELRYSMFSGPLRTRIATTYGANGKRSMSETYMQVSGAEFSNEERLALREIWNYDSCDNWIRHERRYLTLDGRELLMALETREIEYY